LDAHDTIGKFLTYKCLKWLHIVHLNLKCMNYNKKKGHESNWEFDSQPQFPLEQGSSDLWLGHAIHHWKDHFEGYEILPLHVQKKNLIWKRYEHEKI
jgi:hypothetical protein